MVLNYISRTFSRTLTGAGLVGVLAIAVGCENMEEPKSFFDPAQVGRIKDEPLVVPILTKLNIGAEEEDAQFSGARDVTQADLVATASDYGISPNDVLSVSISDLLGPNTVSDRTIRVTQTGKISLPLLEGKPIAVEGKTEQQVEQAIKDAYRDAQILQNAQVSVSVIEARGRTYSVLGAVGAPGLYAIYDTDFRLLDALVTARDVSNTVGTDVIYVIRKKDDAGNADAAPAEQPKQQPGVDPLAPQSDATSILPRKSVMLQDGTAPSGSKVIVDGKELEVSAPPAAEEGAVVTQPAAEGDNAEAFEFNALKEPSDREVVKIPYQSLKMGQLKYNIIIKAGDLIFVPGPVIGEYYMHGNVSAPGAYSLAARKITITQAVAAARGLNDVAWPSRTEIVRRLPGDKQVFVKVDLDKIFAGQEPDIYLKPDDRINVGTHVVAPFLAAFRNGFRLTYGFGFLYDRNYGSDDDNNN